MDRNASYCRNRITAIITSTESSQQKYKNGSAVVVANFYELSWGHNSVQKRNKVIKQISSLHVCLSIRKESINQSTWVVYLKDSQSGNMSINLGCYRGILETFLLRPCLLHLLPRYFSGHRKGHRMSWLHRLTAQATGAFRRAVGLRVAIVGYRQADSLPGSFRR